MLGFVLSKLNLLILATAIFAIVGFFAIGLTGISKVNEASELASRMKEKADALANSASYCISDSYPVPNELYVAGNEFYYVLVVSKEIIELEDGGEVNTLIFSVYSRSEMERSFDISDYKAKAIAATSLRTKADLRLFGTDYDEGKVFTGSIIEQDPIYIDPQAVNPTTHLYFVKEVVGGEPTLYVIGCGPGSLVCSANKGVIGAEIHPEIPGVEEGGFRC